MKLDIGLTLIRFEGIQQVVKRTSKSVRVPLIKEEFGNRWPCQVNYRVFWEDDSSTENTINFTAKDESKNIEIKMKPVAKDCPGRGKMAINLVDAKFLDKTKQPRRIKCTRTPLKLIIKEEGEDKKKKESKLEGEKPTNLFQNILKKGVKLPSVKLPRKFKPKSDDKPELTLAQTPKVVKKMDEKVKVPEIPKLKEEVKPTPKPTKKKEAQPPPPPIKTRFTWSRETVTYYRLSVNFLKKNLHFFLKQIGFDLSFSCKIPAIPRVVPGPILRNRANNHWLYFQSSLWRRNNV